MRRAADLMAVAIIFGESVELRGSSAWHRERARRTCARSDGRNDGTTFKYNQMIHSTRDPTLQIEAASSASQGQAAQRGACSGRQADPRSEVRGAHAKRAVI